MPGIDYSKWDKIDCSSSEDEEEEEVGSRQPTVTRLDAPSTVTRTQDGHLVIGKPQPSRSIEFAAATKKNPPGIHSSTSTSSPSSTIPAAWTEHGGKQALLVEYDSAQLQQSSTLYWSQDRYSVCLRLSLLHTAMKGKDLSVQLEGVRRFQDRCAAVGSDIVSKIQVTYCQPGKQQIILLEGDFPHPIHAAEDDDNYVNEHTPFASSDWTLDRTPHGLYWVMTLYKAVPMEGMVVWWRRPLTQFPELEDHPNPNVAGHAKVQAFQQAWDEAHSQFRDKIQQRKAEQES